MHALVDHAGGLASVTLAELEDRAGLLTRSDRKYLVPPDRLEEVLDRIAPSMHVLDVDGRRHFAYESVYFDTPQLDAYVGAARGSRHRFKVRTRTYVDSGLCFLEVKIKNGRDQTVKQRIEHPAALRDRLTDDARAFVAEHVTSLATVHDLGPTLTTRYVRTTLVGDDQRSTIDTDLSCTRWDGDEVSLTDVAIIETKSTGRPSDVDRALWASGIRPISCSKYALGLATFDPTLPRNKWHVLLSRLSPFLVLSPRSAS